MGTPLRAGRADASSRNWGPHGRIKPLDRGQSMDPVDATASEPVVRMGVPAYSRWRFSIDAHQSIAGYDVTDPPGSALSAKI